MARPSVMSFTTGAPSSKPALRTQRRSWSSTSIARVFASADNGFVLTTGLRYLKHALVAASTLA